MHDLLCVKLQECKKCGYHDWETNMWNPQTGGGKYGCYAYSEDAKIMIVGQNPSHRRFPEPLNHSLGGHQGDIFRKIFGEKNLILTNLVRISTPNNTIDMGDAQHGYTHLLEEIEYYQPRLIIALGRFCKDVMEPKINTVFIKHPDYFMTYRPDQLDEYIKSIEDIKKKHGFAHISY